MITWSSCQKPSDSACKIESISIMVSYAIFLGVKFCATAQWLKLGRHEKRYNFEYHGLNMTLPGEELEAN